MTERTDARTRTPRSEAGGRGVKTPKPGESGAARKRPEEGKEGKSGGDGMKKSLSLEELNATGYGQ